MGPKFPCLGSPEGSHLPQESGKAKCSGSLSALVVVPHQGLGRALGGREGKAGQGGEAAAEGHRSCQRDHFPFSC